jgi:hypothetical protein
MEHIMTLKNIIPMALLSGALGCFPRGPDHIPEPEPIRFADASDAELLTAFRVATSTELFTILEALWELNAADDPCVTITEMEAHSYDGAPPEGDEVYGAGLKYQGSDKTGCSDSMKGTLRITGVTETGWSEEKRTGFLSRLTGGEDPAPEAESDAASEPSIRFIFDDVELMTGEADGGPFVLWGEIEVDQNELTTWLQSTPKDSTSSRSDHSHVHVFTIQVDDSDPAVFTHTAGYGGVEGGGDFYVSGSWTNPWNFEEVQGEFLLEGTDTLRFEKSEADGDCIAYTIDGNADELCVD